MALGVLFDFKKNSDATKVIMAKDMVREDWFQHAVNYTEPTDMFVVLGHNPAGRPDIGSTFPTIFEAIRTIKPNTPITFLGGHAYARDTVIYDNMAVFLASGEWLEDFDV